MTTITHSPRLHLWVQALSGAASALAALALLGYVAHEARLIALLPQWQGMSLLTAAIVLCLAVPLWRPRPSPARRQAVLGWLALPVLLAVLCSHALAGADVISPWIAHALLGMPPALSGRVSVATATGLLCLDGVALVGASRDGLRVRATEIGANLTLLIAGAALLGYAYRITDLYGIYLFDTMSLQSAVALACLALATLVAEPETRLGMALRSPSLGVRQLRRMLALTAMPALLGWLLLHAHGPLASGNGAALAVLVVATGLPMFYLLLENARSVELLERERDAQRAAERRMTDELRDRVDEQGVRLAESHRLQVIALAQAESSKRFEMIAQLTGGIAHDFNNLLRVIGGHAQLLKLRVRGDATMLPFVEKIAATVTGAARLTAQLSAFSRTQRLDTAPFAVDAAVRDAIDETRSAFGTAIELVVRLDGGDSMVLGDRGQFQLALVHVIRNACEAMAQGGRLSVATALRPLADRACVSITIADNGVGMSAEQLERAAEPFYTTKRGNHPGLGLAQVHSVVHQASGTLQLSSQPGAGTTVELSLPCVAVPVVPVPDRRRAQPAPGGSQRLLVIDDDDEVRTVIAALLRQLDYDVVEANGGRDGLALLRSSVPALAIIDYLMPEMNGAEVARRVRLQVPDLPIVFITGYADSQAIAAIPYSRTLRKPVAADELARTVAAALQPA